MKNNLWHGIEHILKGNFFHVELVQVSYLRNLSKSKIFSYFLSSEIFFTNTEIVCTIALETRKRSSEIY